MLNVAVLMEEAERQDDHRSESAVAQERTRRVAEVPDAWTRPLDTAQMAPWHGCFENPRRRPALAG
jgi:hypothetical protein